MSEARDRWLDEGVAVLAAEGAGALRIDRLAARLGLSKGSFHHHFAGAAGFRRDLLGHIERLLTEGLGAAAEGRPGSARDVLTRLTSLIDGPGERLYRPELEVALRAWALTDADAARVQAAVDGARLGALQAVWRTAVASDDDARIAALLPYLVAVGATAVVPPVSPQDLRRVYELILPLVPELPAHDGDA